jgi:hypothetical protein
LTQSLSRMKYRRTWSGSTSIGEGSRWSSLVKGESNV